VYYYWTYDNQIYQGSASRAYSFTHKPPQLRSYYSYKTLCTVLRHWAREHYQGLFEPSLGQIIYDNYIECGLAEEYERFVDNSLRSASSRRYLRLHSTCSYEFIERHQRLISSASIIAHMPLSTTLLDLHDELRFKSASRTVTKVYALPVYVVRTCFRVGWTVRYDMLALAVCIHNVASNDQNIVCCTYKLPDCITRLFNAIPSACLSTVYTLLFSIGILTIFPLILYTLLGGLALVLTLFVHEISGEGLCTYLLN
jgi:hypothetical protein